MGKLNNLVNYIILTIAINIMKCHIFHIPRNGLYIYQYNMPYSSKVSIIQKCILNVFIKISTLRKITKKIVTSQLTSAAFPVVLLTGLFFASVVFQKETYVLQKITIERQLNATITVICCGQLLYFLHLIFLIRLIRYFPSARWLPTQRLLLDFLSRVSE